MADFNTAFPFVLANEDYTPPRYEVVPDPLAQDKNACSISGINSYWFPIDFANLKNMAPADRGPGVAAFYEENFWNKWMAQINSNRVAAMILDSSVNQGGGVAVKLAQQASGMPPEAIDGHLGPNTIAAINGTPESDFVASFVQARTAKYQASGSANTEAWVARAEKVPDFA